MAEGLLIAFRAGGAMTARGASANAYAQAFGGGWRALDPREIVDPGVLVDL